MSVLQPGWLMSRPIAHRGLHDIRAGVIENTTQAFDAAIARRCAIECDVQISADGEAIVFHDFTVERLTRADGRVDALTAQQLTALDFRDAPTRISTLSEACRMIAKRAPLIVEIKSRFNGDLRLADRVAAIASAYAGPLAIKSFDPAVMAHLRHNRRNLRIRYTPLGMVAQSNYDEPCEDWGHLDDEAKFALGNFLHYRETVPDFLSYCVDDMPDAVPMLCRSGIGMPVMTWTVRTPAQSAIARQWADQIIFEGAPPDR